VIFILKKGGGGWGGTNSLLSTLEGGGPRKSNSRDAKVTEFKETPRRFWVRKKVGGESAGNKSS